MARTDCSEWLYIRGCSALRKSDYVSVAYTYDADPGPSLDPTQHLKSTNRYRDIAIHPNGRTIYISTDNQGSSTDHAGRVARPLANPGSIISFSYSGQ